jgi:glycine/D-amino acid oxidase-like deaminating enzyme
LTFGYTEACFRPRLDGGYNLMPGEIMEHELCFDTLAHGFQFLPALMRYRKKSSLIPGFGSGFRRRLFPRRRWNQNEISPFEQTRVLNPPLSRRHFRLLKRRIAKHLPELAQLKIVESWTGSADMTPDVKPAIGPIARYPGLYIASGLSGHGFGLGPGVGKVAAQSMLEQLTFDITPFRFERFTDGSRLNADLVDA